MTLQIPENLKKYCSLAEGEDIIDRFVCPIEGCGFDTRLGPGAIRMHMMMKSDPLSAVYEDGHETFYKEHQSELTMNSIKELAKVPFRKISYRKP
jgi:hypothetical protein